MVVYLLQHNMTMRDFWIFLVMWVLGLLFLIFLWRQSWKVFNRDEAWDGGMLYFTTLGYTVVSVPLLLMGAWHFILMIISLF